MKSKLKNLISKFWAIGLIFLISFNSLYSIDNHLLELKTNTSFTFFQLLNQDRVLFEDSVEISDKKISVQDTVIPINSVSLISSNSQFIDKFLIDRKNFFSPIHLINWQTNSFLLDLGLPSNFYDFSLFQADNRSTSFLINNYELNDPLTNIIDLRDLRFDEFESIEIIFPTRSFLLSRYNNPATIVFNEWKRYSPIPYSRIKYIEAPYDNLFFDGMFNVNLTKKINFEFGITKHNAFGRFINSEKDLWAGKLKSTYYLSNQLNFNLTYRYSKSLTRFNEGINLNNPLLAPEEPVENILYDNQRALVINDDAYHKWTNHRINFQTLFKLSDFSLTQMDFYFNQSLREFRDNEHKADSLRVFKNYWSKVFGFELKENANFSFNQLELQLRFEKSLIESPVNNFTFLKKIDYQLMGYAFYELNLFERIKPSFYVKYTGINKIEDIFFSYGTDLTFKISNKVNFILGYSDFDQILSYDEKLFSAITGLKNIRTRIFSGRFSYSTDNLKFNLESYYREAKVPSFVYSDYRSIEYNGSIIKPYPELEKLFGGKFDVQYSFLKVNSTFSVLFNDRIQNFNGTTFHRIIQPRFQSRFEVYYRDLLFKSSLDLIAGFRVNIFSSFSARSFSPSNLYFVDVRTYNDTLFNFASIRIPSNFTIDLFASGRVKENAIVYISIENLLDRKFYLVPYYPANDIQFRFGIAWEFYD